MVGWSTMAFAARSVWTTSRWPFHAAMMSGVVPYLLPLLMQVAPASRYAFTLARLPSLAALVRLVMSSNEMLPVSGLMVEAAWERGYERR